MQVWGFKGAPSNILRNFKKKLNSIDVPFETIQYLMFPKNVQQKIFDRNECFYQRKYQIVLNLEKTSFVVVYPGIFDIIARKLVHLMLNENEELKLENEKLKRQLKEALDNTKKNEE